MNLALISTVFYRNSHTDVITARWFEDLSTDKAWGWNGPRTKIVSAYVAQFPDNDLARETFKQQHAPLYSSVQDALTLGGKTLAVDGVILIAEHGDYPYNRYGQKLYPRKELFDEIARTFDASGCSVPVFCDKHLSWDYDLAKLMLDGALSRNFDLLASSSLPFCHFEPTLITEGAQLEELVAVFPNVHGQPDHYGYHALEIIQQHIERRAGHEKGISSVTAWLGADVWRAQDEGLWDKEMLEAALDAANPDAEGDYRDESKREFPTHAFKLEYRDGLNVTLVGITPLEDFAFALRHKGRVEAETSLCVSGKEPERYPHFATLSRVIENFMLDGTRPFPPERSLLTAGALQAMLQALALPGTTFPTPHLAISYDPAEPGVGLDFWPQNAKAHISDGETL